MTRLVTEVRRLVGEWLQGESDPQAAVRAVQARIRGRRHEWLYHLARKQQLQEAPILRKLDTPKAMLKFLQSVSDLSGPVPALAALVAAGAHEAVDEEEDDAGTDA